MKTFLVMVPPKAKGSEDLAMKMVFLRDGFSLLALLYPAIWLLLKRMWVVLICYLLITFSLVMAGSAVSGQTAFLMALMVSFIIGFEGRALHRWALERRGWRLAAVVRADSTEEAERRFFAEWLQRAVGRDGERGRDAARGSENSGASERPDPPVRSAARDRVPEDAPPTPAAPVPQIPRPTIGDSAQRHAPEPPRATSSSDTVRTSPFRTVPRTAAPDAAAAARPREPSPEVAERGAAGEDAAPAPWAGPDAPEAASSQRSDTPAGAGTSSFDPAAVAAKPAGGARRLPMFPPKGGR
jgi:hypothetical protein